MSPGWEKPLPYLKDFSFSSHWDFYLPRAWEFSLPFTFGYETALQSLEEALRRDTVDRYSVEAVAARIALDGLHALPDSGPDLLAYDQVLREAQQEARS